jgi:transmembrane sensor
VEAILVNGKITLESRQQPVNQVTLAPDQRVVFDKETERMSFDNQVRAQSLTAWKDGRLVFENLSLRDIKVMLERWYNVTITIEDEGSLGCYFSGQFYNKSLKEVLEMMKTSDDVSVRVEGHRAVIRGKLCED